MDEAAGDADQEVNFYFENNVLNFMKEGRYVSVSARIIT